jgi:hypothetical protein
MQTRDKDNDNKKQAAEEKRDLDLENIVGNLFIAEYQADKLRTRLADLVYGYRPKMSNNKASTQIFKHNNKWYKLSLRVDEVNVTPAKDIIEQEFDY